MKLADFGLSHFERKKAGKEEIVNWDSHGSMVYGKLQSNTLMQEPTERDIWQDPQKLRGWVKHPLTISQLKAQASHRRLTFGLWAAFAVKRCYG